MDLSGQVKISSSADWGCSRCGQTNWGEDKYCRKCGSPQKIAAEEMGVPNSRTGKLVWIIFLGLIILGALSAGGYFWHKNNLKNQAKNYIEQEGKTFSQTINLINNLSTEKDMTDEDDNDKLFLKKLEEENGKSEKAAVELKNFQEKNQKASANKLVRLASELLGGFYKNAQERTIDYDQYIAYRVADQKEDIILKEEMEKVEVVFKNARSIEEVSSSIKAMKKVFEESLARYEKLVPPHGLEDAHKKEIELGKKMIDLYGKFAEAVDSKNSQNVAVAYRNLEEFMNDEKAVRDIEQMEKYYFEEMHNRFLSLRKEADTVRTELIRSSATLQADLANIEMEGW